MSVEQLLITHNLSVGYRDKTVLTGIDIHLCKGEMVALLGANGRGKSTLLRTLSRVQPPVSGEIELKGRDMSSFSSLDLARVISLVYTDRTQAGALTVKEVVSLGRQPYTGFFGRLDAEDKAIVSQAIEAVGISGLENRHLATLSDGERQKAMIARAIAQQGEIILLDEPTAFLDVASRLETFSLLKGLAHEQGKGIVVSTHDVTDVLECADSAWIIPSDVDGLVCGDVSKLIDEGVVNALFPGRDIVFDPVSRRFRPEC